MPSIHEGISSGDGEMPFDLEHALPVDFVPLGKKNHTLDYKLFIKKAL